MGEVKVPSVLDDEVCCCCCCCCCCRGGETCGFHRIVFITNHGMDGEEACCMKVDNKNFGPKLRMVSSFENEKVSTFFV